MSEIKDKIDDAVAVIPAFDQESGAWNCEYCGNDLYSACPTCAIKQINALTAELTEAKKNHQSEKHLSEVLFNRAVRAENELAEEREQYEETEKDHLNQITQLVVDKIKLKAELDRWITYHDAAVEDAKNWRRDAQELQAKVLELSQWNTTGDK